MKPIDELLAFCRAHGIPEDRARLVSRNMVLAEHVRSCHKMIQTQCEMFHEVFKHEGEWIVCDKALCVHGREVLAKFKEEVK